MPSPKITLIVPPNLLEHNKFWGNSTLYSHVRRFPSLGLGYIAAVLEKNGYRVNFLDMYASEISYEDLTGKLKKDPPEIVGITCNTATFIPARNVARIIKKWNPACTIIIGGPHPDVYPKETASLDEFDIAVFGEGEYTMLEVVKCLELGKDINNVKGIAFKKAGKTIVNPSRPIIKNLDELPFPSRHLMPYKKYTSVLKARKYMTTVIISRGCPFNCLYCVLGRSWRGRDPIKVVDELENVQKKFGINEFFFIDSTFTYKKIQVQGICMEIIRRKLDIIWQCSTRVDCVDQELLYLMKKAGCTRVQFGVESGDQRVLKILRKGITLKQVENAVSWSKKARLEVFLFFMLGAPGDTIQSIKKTINFAKRMDPDFVTFVIASAQPGTDMLDLWIKEGVVNENLWRNFASGKTNKMPQPFNRTDEFDLKRLEKIKRLAYIQFYLRPKYFFNRILKIKSFLELINNIRGFKDILLEIFT